MKKIIFVTIIAILVMLSSCKECPTCPEPADFSANGFTYSIDTLKLDTAFTDPNATIYDSPKLSEMYTKLLSQKTDLLSKNKNFNFQLNEVSASSDIPICATKPVRMTDLTGGLQKFFYKFTANSSVDLELFGYGGGKLGKKEVLLIVDFVQFKNVDCSGESVRFGVGARLFLNIKSFKSSININKLPMLAAAAEFDKATVTYNISTIGIVGDKVLDALPTGAEFNVESYAKVVSAVDQIIRLAKDNTTGVNIEPQVLPVVKN